METIDVQTYSGSGPFPCNTRALANKAQQPVPGRPGYVWGVGRVRAEAVYTIAALSSMAEAVPGKRVFEFLKEMEIRVKGWERPACKAGGRVAAEYRRVQEGKVTYPAPTDLADADATLTRRVVHEFSFVDERLADRMQHVPHAIALHDGGITYEFLTAALVTGATFTSVVITTRVEYVPIPARHMPIPISLREQAAGNGTVAQTRIDTPIGGKLLNLWLFFKGIRTSGCARPQFLETVDLTYTQGGQIILDRQTIQALMERIVPELYDAAAEEVTTTPEECHLLFPGQSQILVSALPDAYKAGELVASASMDDSGNTSTELRWASVTVEENLVGSQTDRQYAGSIAPVHLKGETEWHSVPQAADGRKTVSLKMAGFVPRLLMPKK